MTKGTFLKEVKEGNVPTFDNYSLYYHKRYISLVNETDYSEQRFKNLEDAYENAVINEKRLKDIVEKSEYEDMFVTTLDDGGIKII